MRCIEDKFRYACGEPVYLESFAYWDHPAIGLRQSSRSSSTTRVFRNYHFSDCRVPHCSTEIWKEIARIGLSIKTEMIAKTNGRKRSIESSGVARVELERRTETGSREAAYWSRLVCISVEYSRDTDRKNWHSQYFCLYTITHEMLDMTFNQRKHAYNEAEHRCDWQDNVRLFCVLKLDTVSYYTHHKASR